MRDHNGCTVRTKDVPPVSTRVYLIHSVFFLRNRDYKGKDDTVWGLYITLNFVVESRKISDKFSVIHPVSVKSR